MLQFRTRHISTGKLGLPLAPSSSPLPQTCSGVHVGFLDDPETLPLCYFVHPQQAKSYAGQQPCIIHLDAAAAWLAISTSGIFKPPHQQTGKPQATDLDSQRHLSLTIGAPPLVVIVHDCHTQHYYDPSTDHPNELSSAQSIPFGRIYAIGSLSPCHCHCH